MTAASDCPRVYLDYNATAPLRPEARAAALACMAMPANPSSVHAEGRCARAAVETARMHVAALFGRAAGAVVFTSGASEAAALVLAPDLAKNLAPGTAATEGAGHRSAGSGFDRLVLSATEHAAVLRGHRFPASAVSIAPVLASGVIDLAALARLLGKGGRAVVALQVANNETGVLQPLDAVAEMVRTTDAVLVTDAVQAAGRVPCAALPADIALVSGHKLGGLAGAGAAVMLSPEVTLGAPLLQGGGQERGLRAGTENVPAIAAFGAAATACRSAEADGSARMRDRFEEELLHLAGDAVVFGRETARLPNTSAFAVPGIAAERLMMALDLAGIAVSSGSACASGKIGRSHVLEAMGVTPDLRSCAMRVSFGWNSAESDLGRLVEALGVALQRMRSRRLQAAA